jgi:hypothetical protein
MKELGGGTVKLVQRLQLAHRLLAELLLQTHKGNDSRAGT